MATSVSIDASRLNDLLGRFDNAGPVVDREGEAALTRSALAVQGDAQKNLTANGSVDTGTLRRSITTRMSPMEAAIGTNQPHGEVVEVGRRAGAAWPPPGSLVGWMRRHGMNPAHEWLLRKKIGQQGIAAKPYLVPALEDNEPAMQREFDLAADRALAELMR